ncbi:MAG: cyclase, partial [Epsilonproteobacteria bacterium]|nr:cyclase [Campylobacterota bacterium]
MIYLSYTLNRNTPTYGDRNRFRIDKKSSIE